MGAIVVGQIALAVALIIAPLHAQGGAQEKRTIASVLDHQFTAAEQDVVAAAEAMPEAAYSFVPTNGEFKGVRTFGQQLKHVAVYNFRTFGAMLGEKPGARRRQRSGLGQDERADPEVRSRFICARAPGDCHGRPRQFVERREELAGSGLRHAARARDLCLLARLRPLRADGGISAHEPASSRRPAATPLWRILGSSPLPGLPPLT